MVKLYDLVPRATAEGGETVLGADDLETHACYLMYGVVEAGGNQRLLNPGPGHEEIFVLVSGQAILEGPQGSQELRAGQAFHLVGEVHYHLTNPGPGAAVYVAAGGHGTGHDHHHHHHH